MTEQTGFAKLDFTTFVLSVASAAYMGLGIAPPGAFGDPSQKDQLSVDLELARQNIDLLELLLEKTKGNLSHDEDRLLQQLLFETRLRFVEAQRKMQGGK